MARSDSAKDRFREQRRRMRERGDFTFDTLEREHKEEWRRQYEYDEAQRHTAGCCHGGSDIIPPRPVRLFGWFLFLAFFLGSMIFIGVKVGWFAPLSLIVGVCVILLPSTIEFLCRGNRVLKHDRGSFFIWY